MILFNDERCMDYGMAGHPERPSRIRGSLALLKKQSDVSIEWRKPIDVEESWIEAAHAPELIHQVAKEVHFDSDTPGYKGIDGHARRAVGAAVGAMKLALDGARAFSLMRPPGHHATRERAMGFCYFNSIAIAVLEAVRLGSARVGVFDFDVHHGNGTEDILLDNPHVRFQSVHQSPCYPGTGLRDRGTNCFNFTVAPGIPREQYRQKLEKGLKSLADFEPDLIAVSAGFDAYARDPLAQGTLESEDYHWLGRKLKEFGKPVFSVLEGGYSDDLPDLIRSYLAGIV